MPDHNVGDLKYLAMRKVIKDMENVFSWIGVLSKYFIKVSKDV